MLTTSESIQSRRQVDTMESPPVIWEARGICRRYGRKSVLKDISFSLAPGKVLGLFGPNGSGKTTLLEIVALAKRPSSGQIYFNGGPVNDSLSQVRPLIGYVPQDIALFEELTVMDNLRTWSRLPRSQTRTRIGSVLSELYLESIAGQKVMALSGGMKRRVNLAVAMIGKPSLLVLDEPFAGVDYDHQEIMRQVLARLSQNGVSQFISGHHIDDVLPLLDQIMILRDGMQLYYGEKDEFCRLLEGADPRQTLKAILDGQLI